jgi:hypothetical protein
MRRPLSHKAAALLALAAATLAPALAGAVSVRLDESTLVSLRAPAGEVIVGNPSVADVNLIGPSRMAILGRGYGVTNIIVTDRMGRAIFNEEISVTSVETGRVSVYRGGLISNFTCTPRCARTPLPGEDKANADPYASTYKDYASRAKDGAGGASAP